MNVLLENGQHISVASVARYMKCTIDQARVLRTKCKRAFDAGAAGLLNPYQVSYFVSFLTEEERLINKVYAHGLEVNRRKTLVL